MIKSVLIGSLCAVLAQIILLCIVSLVMISTKKLFTGALDYIMTAVSATGSLIGGFVSAKLNRGAGLIVGLITGFAVYIMLTVAALINGGSPLSVLSLIRSAAMLLGGAAGGMLGVREKTKIKI
jgi:putative membrane protein (TIGR04086 family)